MQSFMFRADLHCHSHCSDGSLSPQEMVLLAKKLHLSGLAITDHDNFDAYALALPVARENNILLGTGVEFSCEMRNESVHILGYDFDPLFPDLLAFCETHQKGREMRNRKILENLSRNRMPISEEQLKAIVKEGNKSIGRPHIAQLMVSAGYVSTIKEAFNRFLGRNQSCYEPGILFTVDETIRHLRKAGGKAFIAHPHLIAHARVIKELLTLPFDGIECYYGITNAAQEKPWIRIAEEKGWLISGGSDFHGSFKPHIPLGASWVDENAFLKIFTRS